MSLSWKYRLGLSTSLSVNLVAKEMSGAKLNINSSDSEKLRTYWCTTATLRNFNRSISLQIAKTTPSTQNNQYATLFPASPRRE